MTRETKLNAAKNAKPHLFFIRVLSFDHRMYKPL